MNIKRLLFFIGIILSYAPLFGWTFKQSVNFDDKTHQSVQSFAHAIERSSEYLADSINKVAEHGVPTPPLNIDEHVWFNVKHIILIVALSLMGGAISLVGLIGLRKRLINAHQETVLLQIYYWIASITIVLTGIVLICASSKLALLVLY